MSPEQREIDDNQTPALEMAYVLFMDIVGYSRMPTDVQQETLRRLQRSVRCGNEFKKAQEQQRLISLPTGDGMALVFFTDPEGCVRCAVEITRALKDEQGIPLRIGMHAGPVFRVADINANANVAGEGINIAQRVMDCGDAGHILVSKSLADVLRQLSGWMGALQDLGEISVKHDVKVHVYNLLVEGAGNPEKPERFGPQKKKPAREKERTWPWKMWIAVAAGVVLVGGGIAWRLRPVYAYRPKIALLGFADQQNNEDNEWVSQSLTDYLTSELGSTEKVVPVPDETVSRMKRDLSLTREVSYSPGTMKTVRAYLGCDYVVYGSFLDIGKEAGGRVQVNVRMQNTATGEVWSFPTESGSEQTLSDLAGAVGGRVLAKLGLPSPSVLQIKEQEDEMPASPAARKMYAKGLASLWKYDLNGATENLEAAIKLEPSFPLAHSELAETWMRQGYDDKAREEAGKAKELSLHLRRETKLRVEAAFQEMSFDWDEAAESYKALWRFVRERPEYAYRAADVQIRGGRAEAALATIADLRKQPGEMQNSPIIDLREAEAYDELSRFKDEVAAAGTTIEKAHALGARSLEAEALWRLCGAKLSLGDFEGAESDCHRSDRIAADLKYPLIAARAQANLGVAARGRGNFAEGLAAEQKALEIATSVGSQRDVIGAWQNMGIIWADQGDHQNAVKSYEKALEVANETKNKTAMSDNYNNVATEYQAAGDLKQAVSNYEKSLELAHETKKSNAEVDARNNIGSLQLLQGQLKEASANVEEALRIAKQDSFSDKIPSLLTTLGDIRMEQGNLTESERNYQEALALSGQGTANASRASTQLSLSRLKVEQGDSPSATKYAKEAADEFQKEGMKEEGSGALAVLAEALTEQAKFDEATAALKSANEAKPGDRAIQLSLDCATARLLARSGKRTEAKDIQLKALGGAKKMGMLGWELRLELVAAEFGFANGSGKPDLPALRRVEREAGSAGYGLIEDQAKRLFNESTTIHKGD